MKVLAIDSIVNEKDSYLEYLRDHGIEMDRVKNGENLHPRIKYNHYDVIILDIILPYADGLKLINVIKSISPSSAIIVYTYVSNDSIIQEAFRNGADYYAIKPSNFDLLLNRIKSFSNTDTTSVYIPKSEVIAKPAVINQEVYNVDKSIRDLLKEIGITANLKGYNFMVDAISMYIDNKGSFDPGITKHVYPEIAKKYHSTPARVERNIRHSIEKCWEQGSYDKLQEIFGYTIPSPKYKPTNSCFIAEMSEYIMKR